MTAKTLLDEFAMAALNYIPELRGPITHEVYSRSKEEIAKYVYEIANAMMRERKKYQNDN